MNIEQKSQIRKFHDLLQRGPATVENARQQGIANPRQQIYFLRSEGVKIINCDKETYRIID